MEASTAYLPNTANGSYTTERTEQNDKVKKE
jgi:hypothetical protein